MAIADPPENLHETRVAPGMPDTFEQDIVAGFTAPTGQKATPPKHLYDAKGSKIFEDITEADDYYPTRTESSIFDEHLATIADVIGEGATLIEPGSGSGEKGERILAALHKPRAFVPLEISGSALAESAESAAERFPEVAIMPVCADFTEGLSLIDHAPTENRVIFFPGSTIGNLTHEEREELLGRFARAVGPGGRLLLCYDREKDHDVLRAAYNDSQGVTAEFNLNLIDRINRELGGTLNRDDFEHDAVWNDDKKRIEMHLVAKRAVDAEIAGRRVTLEADERVHTESSHKFADAQIDAEAASAGFTLLDRWSDARGWFAVALYELKS
jgi:dimethylhistidine N-methyltransferase